MAPWPTVDGEWEALARTDRGAGAPVLLVHGQPGTARDWDPVARRLEDDHRVIVVDRPGYGDSPGEARSMRANAELLADLVTGRVGQPVVVVGHSYGGGVALLMAGRRPEVVAGLVLVASVGSRRSVNGIDHLLASSPVGVVLSGAGLFTLGRVLPRVERLARRLPSTLARRIRSQLPDERYGAEVSRAGMRLWRSFLVEQRALVAEVGDVEATARHVAVPTAVMTGTWDAVVAPPAAAALAATIRGSELVVVAGAGHFLTRDAPTAVVDTVRRVARRSEGRGG